MLYAQLFEYLAGRLGATGLHILIPFPNCVDRFLVILPLLFQVCGQGMSSEAWRTDAFPFWPTFSPDGSIERVTLSDALVSFFSPAKPFNSTKVY